MSSILTARWPPCSSSTSWARRSAPRADRPPRGRRQHGSGECKRETLNEYLGFELLLVRHAGDREGDPLAARQAALQRNVETLHGLYGQDIVVLDRDKRIVADAVAPEIGMTTARA